MLGLTINIVSVSLRDDRQQTFRRHAPGCGTLLLRIVTSCVYIKSLRQFDKCHNVIFVDLGSSELNLVARFEGFEHHGSRRRKSFPPDSTIATKPISGWVRGFPDLLKRSTTRHCLSA